MVCATDAGSPCRSRTSTCLVGRCLLSSRTGRRHRFFVPLENLSLKPAHASHAREPNSSVSTADRFA